MLFNRTDFKKFLRFPYGQSTQPSTGFKTSAQDFQILSKAIQTTDWNYEVLRENQKLNHVAELCVLLINQFFIGQTFIFGIHFLSFCNC